MAKKAPSQILETHGVTTLVHEMKDLPNEMLSEILSYVGNKEKLSVSLVNKRWLQIINSQIEGLESITIRRPTTTDNLEELQNLLNRFPKLRSLSLANRINDISELVPLKSLAFKKFSLEFYVGQDLIETINPKWTSIKRVKIENFEGFENFEYKPNTIIHFEVNITRSNFEVEEEIMSLNFLKRIALDS